MLFIRIENIQLIREVKHHILEEILSNKIWLQIERMKDLKACEFNSMARHHLSLPFSPFVFYSEQRACQNGTDSVAVAFS